ncbi:MAG: hypothetical protein CMF45_04305 [Legionellales bacterium]|nr:hypothetical protein [Legionellales bacterium]|tara:strand:- start:220 stop:1155 length:936 start_codon:yes stop_codon:yes gene_type:complete
MDFATEDSTQTPSGSEVFLDHVGWFVPDIRELDRAMKRLGFILTPFVEQKNADPNGGAPVRAGTGNCCAMMQRGYLEFLAAVPDIETPLSQQLEAALDRYHGLHLLAFTVDDSAAAHERLSAGGFAPQDPVHLRRPLTLGDGSEAEVAFTVLRVPPEKMPEGRIQMLRQETPDLVWHENIIARDNGIIELGGVILCVDNVEEAASRFSRFIGRDVEGTSDYRSLSLDRGRLGFATVKELRERLPGLKVPTTPFMATVCLKSVDLVKTRSFLAKADIITSGLSDHAFLVSPEDACGASIIIYDEDDIWPPNN